jgi:hypothetical protein
MIAAIGGSVPAAGTYLDTSNTSQSKIGSLTISGLTVGNNFSNSSYSGLLVASGVSNSLALGPVASNAVIVDTSGRMVGTSGFLPGGAGAYGTAGIYSGSAAPTLNAANGSLYMRYDGSGSTLLYQNTSGASSSGNTWVPFVGGVMAGGTGTITSVGASVTSVVLHAASAARLGIIITNDSSANLYVAFAASATTSAYSVKLGPGAIYESDAALYTGVITGIWDSATGNARITEVTA